MNAVTANDSKLTHHEKRQIAKIAGWKAEPPSYLYALVEQVTKPLVKAVEFVVSPDSISEAINNAYASSEIQCHREKVAERAKVDNIRELLSREMEFCDQLADEVAWECAEKAMFWGAGGGGPNLVSTLISLNALMTYCLKTIHSIGYCYGFSPDEDHERGYVLGILLVACASTLKEKQDAVTTLAKVEDMIFEEAFEDLLEDVVASEIIRSAGLNSIPLVGMLTGAMHAASLTEHTAGVAKYCFQERWLRRHGKVERIAPDRTRARSIIRRSKLRLENSVYWGAFGTTFLLCVPIAWVVSWLPQRNPVTNGIVDGKCAATSDAIQLAQKLTGMEKSLPGAEELIDVAAV